MARDQWCPKCRMSPISARRWRFQGWEKVHPRQRNCTWGRSGGRRVAERRLQWRKDDGTSLPANKPLLLEGTASSTPERCRVPSPVNAQNIYIFLRKLLAVPRFCSFPSSIPVLVSMHTYTSPLFFIHSCPTKRIEVHFDKSVGYYIFPTNNCARDCVCLSIAEEFLSLVIRSANVDQRPSVS